jgi:hypothetical protein
VALETEDVVALSTSQVASLTTAQIVALETADFAALTTDQVAALTTAQVAAIQTSDLAVMSTTQIAALTTADMAALGTAQAASMTTAQVAALTTTQLVAMETVDLCSLTDVQVSALTSDQMNALGTTGKQAALFASTPIMLDLNGDGVHTLSRNAGVVFDVDATGTPVSTGWIAPTDGLLVRDRNGDGVINNGSELYGSGTPDGQGGKTPDGFAALRLEDSNTDGVVDALDQNFATLQVWRDVDGDGRTDAGELQSMTDADIASLSVASQATAIIDSGNLVGLMGSFTTTDGVTHQLADVWLRTGDAHNRTFDLATLPHEAYNAGTLAQIDLSGNGGMGDTLKVGASDVLAFGGTSIDTSATQMLVKGDATDKVVVDNADGAWSRSGTSVVDGVSFAVYSHGNAQLLVDEKVNLLI